MHEKLLFEVIKTPQTYIGRLNISDSCNLKNQSLHFSFLFSALTKSANLLGKPEIQQTNLPLKRTRFDVLDIQTNSRAVVRTAAGCDQVLASTLPLEGVKRLKQH